MTDTIPDNNLSELRKSRGWTQADVGEYLGVAVLTVCRHETRVTNVPPNMLAKYCRLYQVGAEDIYGSIDAE